MQVNYLKKVVQNSAGETAVKIVDLLHNKKDINEFLIAKKLGLTINQTRNLLYNLSHLGILSSTRKKDKRRGWYIYFWTFDVQKSLQVLEESLNTEIIQLKNQLANKQTKRFYKCSICGREVNEETALLNDFICVECGEVYILADNKEAISQISKEIDKLTRELDSVRKELVIVRTEKSKKLNRRLKREEKKKKDLRRNKRIEREKLKIKLMKKNIRDSKKRALNRKIKKKIKKKLKKKR